MVGSDLSYKAAEKEYHEEALRKAKSGRNAAATWIAACSLLSALCLYGAINGPIDEVAFQQKIDKETQNFIIIPGYNRLRAASGSTMSKGTTEATAKFNSLVNTAALRSLRAKVENDTRNESKLVAAIGTVELLLLSIPGWTVFTESQRNIKEEKKAFANSRAQMPKNDPA